MPLVLNATNLRMTPANLYGQPQLNLAVNLSAGAGITLTPNPITGVGTIAVTNPFSPPLLVNQGGSGVITFTAGYIKSPGGTTALVSQAVPIPIADGGTGLVSAPANNSVIYTAAGAYTGDNTKLYFDGTSAAIGAVSGAKTATLEVASLGASNQAIRVRASGAGLGAVQFTDVTGASDYGGISAASGFLSISPPTGGQVLLSNLYAPGTFSVGQASVALANGLNSNIATPAASFVTGTGPTLAFSIGGLTGGIVGRKITLYNTTSQTMTIVNEDASSTATNRIKTLTGANYTLPAGAQSVVGFVYDSTDQRWILTNDGSNLGYVKADGTVPLTANWNAGRFSIASANSSDFVNISKYATAGVGTSASPWTGWDTAIGTPLPNTHYYAPAGFYSYATSLNWGQNGLWLQGDSAGINGANTADGGSVFVCTGTGDVFTVNGNNGTPNGEYIRIENIVVKTSNASSTGNGFMLKNLVYCTFINVRARDCGAAGFYLENVQNSTFTKPVVLGSDGAGFPVKIPVNGINMNVGGNTANTFNSPSIELGVVAPAADAVVLGSGAFQNVFIGGALQSNRGRGFNVAGYLNTFISVDLEGNTGTEDILVNGGENNVFIACRATSAGTTNSIHFTTGSRGANSVLGGHFNKAVLIDSGAIGNDFKNVRFGSGITDNSGGLSTFAQCYDVTNSKFYPDQVMRRVASRASDNTSQSIANSTLQTVTFNTNAFASDTMHSTSVNTSRFTVPVGGGGLYAMYAHLTYAISVSGGSRGCYWKKNGTTIIYDDGNGNPGTTGGPSAASFGIDLAVDGDYYEVQAFQNSGGALLLNSDPLTIYATVYKAN